MQQGMHRTIGPGARVAGALICAVLLAVEIAWAVRDIRATGFHDTFRNWLGLSEPARQSTFLATGSLDVVLAVLLAGALLWALRPGAGWAFLTAGLFASAYRLPGVWIFQADWADGAPLHTRALATGIGFTLAGLALVLIALAGRRPVSDAGSAFAGPAFAGPGTSGSVTEPPPMPSRRGAAAAAGVLLVLLAAEGIGWEIFDWHKYGNNPGYTPHLYAHLLSGKGTLSSLLAAPPAYLGWLWAALALGTAAAAFAGSPAARPLGIAFGFSVVFSAVVALDLWHTEHRLWKFDELPTYLKTQQVLLVAEVVAALLVVLLLALPGRHPGPRPAPLPGWGPPAPRLYGGPQAGGWGAPPQQDQGTQPSQPPHRPQQSPAPGVFGPPPSMPGGAPPRTPPLPPGYPPDRP